MTQDLGLPDEQQRAGVTSVPARRIGLISDDHNARDDGGDLPAEVLAAFEGVDLIVHLGHMGVRGVLDRLESVAPVLAVRDYSRDPDGNTVVTPADGERVAGLTRVVDAKGLRIGAIHNLAHLARPPPILARYRTMTFRRSEDVDGKGEHDEVHDTVEKHSKMFRDLMLGFVRVHILHHANRGPVYGSGISARASVHQGAHLLWLPLRHGVPGPGGRRQHGQRGRWRQDCHGRVDHGGLRGSVDYVETSAGAGFTVRGAAGSAGCTCGGAS